MSTTAIVIVVVAGVVIFACVAAFLVNRELQQRRLARRFGPEYDRVMAAADSHRQGTATLRDRAQTRDRLPIHPLSDSQRQRYEEEWNQIQSGFVDAPERSLERADALLTNVMVDEGYPMQDFEGQADLMSVDHPGVVERYRSAHETQVASQAGRASTEEVRAAFVGYRELFTDLLDEQGVPSRGGTSGAR